jgi:hypothetical protein
MTLPKSDDKSDVAIGCAVLAAIGVLSLLVLGCAGILLATAYRIAVW